MSLDNRPLVTAPLTGVDDLVEYFRGGEKGAHEQRVGMEHEKIGLLAGSTQPIPFGGERGIRRLLAGLSRFGYDPFLEEGEPIAATQRSLSVSLEPGGQLELSGRPFHCCNDLAEELTRHLALMRAIAAELGHVWLGVGYRPFGTTADAQWMPKGRYQRMRRYFEGTGEHGIDMMTMTATVQANYDYLDEADAVRKLRYGTLISPLVTALFANSPLRDGKKTGFLSFRTQVWGDVDPARCGLRPEVFAPDFGYRAYTDWALDIPMVFVRRAHIYLDPRGLTFRRFLSEGLAGERATISDWEDHLTTLFPEIRLKRVVEVRGADVGDARMCLALPALWKGLLYRREALEAAAALVPLDFAELRVLQEDVSRRGLGAEVRGNSVRELCRELISLATHGLRDHERCGPSEADFLEPLHEIVDRGTTPAEVALKRLDGEFGGDVEKLVEHWRVA